MKKYTITDSRGNKKIIYTNNVANAIRLAGIKMKDDDKVHYKIEVYGTGKTLFDLDKLDKLEKRYQKIGKEAYQQLLTVYSSVSKEMIVWAKEVSNNPKKYIASSRALQIDGIGPNKYKVKVISNDPRHYKIMFYDMSLPVAKQIHKEMNRFYIVPLKKFFNKPDVSDVISYTGSQNN